MENEARDNPERDRRPAHSARQKVEIRRGGKIDDRIEGYGQGEQAEWSIARNGIATQGRLHPSMRGYGTGQAIVGSRADLLVGDDLIDYNLSRTTGMRKFVKEWFHNSFLSRLKSGGRVILIGTAWNCSDLYSDIRQAGEGWVICKTSLLQDGPCYAELYYPDNFIGQMLGEPQ